MGFTTGLLSGTALTLGTTYLLLQTHAHNRASQASLLRQSSLSLNQLVDPKPATSSPRSASASAYYAAATRSSTTTGSKDAGTQEQEGGEGQGAVVLAANAATHRGRPERGGVLETAKDRWNAQLTAEVRKLQETDWGVVRERMERGMAVVWDRITSAGSGGGSSS